MVSKYEIWDFSMAKLTLVKQGKIFLGVCKGLEASGRGSALVWRVIFLVTSCFLWFPLFVYLGMGMFLPVADKKDG